MDQANCYQINSVCFTTFGVTACRHQSVCVRVPSATHHTHRTSRDEASKAVSKYVGALIVMCAYTHVAKGDSSYATGIWGRGDGHKKTSVCLKRTEKDGIMTK